MCPFPTSPFSTPLSGSAKEVEERIRNIFQYKKKRPPLLFFLLACVLALSCGGLVSCDGHTPEEPSTVEEPSGEAASQGETAVPAPTPQAELSPDLNHNGIPEEVQAVEAYGSLEIQFWEDGQLVAREFPGTYLCALEGRDYILRLSLEEYQGSFFYSYLLADLSGEFEETVQWGRVTFDLSFNSPLHQGFDPEAIAAFVEEADALLAHSLLLTEAEGELATEKATAVALDWLDRTPEVFVRDPGASLAENLRAFQRAMTQALGELEPLGEADTLPLEEPLQMVFSSGAGAWYTALELRPDGSFTGDYRDADADTVYVCQFHGTFRDFVQLTESSWLLTLDELTLDTGRPLGAEWDQEGFHYISSGPHGFTDQEGNALSSGAQFILYTPEAQGHAPGTELYGAYDFWTWWPDRHTFHSASDTLGCYGLYNLEARTGFFS